MSETRCTTCDTEIPNGSDQCPECGLPIVTVEQAQCPECSNPVDLTAVSCPECGFPFENVDEGRGNNIPSDAATSQSLAQGDGPLSTGESDPDSQPLSEYSPLPEKSIDPDNAVEGNNPVMTLEAQIIALNAITENINLIISSHDKANTELLNNLAEQNKITANSVKEIASSVTHEFITAAGNIKESSAASVADINNAAKQAKDDIAKYAAKISVRSGNIIDYIFIICALMLFFSLINLIITAYILRVIK